MAGPAPIQPTGNAGEFRLADGTIIKLTEWREGDFYDTVTQALGAISAGTELVFFRDLTGKNLESTNLKTQNKLPANSEFIMNRIGLLFQQAFSNSLVAAADILKAAYASSLTFKINDRLIAEAMAIAFPSGLGMSGNSTENAISTITTGVPSTAAAPTLLVAQRVSDKDEMNATLNYRSDSWITGAAVMPTLAGRIVVKLVTHGFIKRPQGA